MQRTGQQRKAIEVYCREVAKALNNEGVTFNDMVKAIEKAEVMPTQENVKVLFQAMCHAMYKTHHTSKLETNQVDKVYESFNLWLAHHFELHIPFPADDLKGLEE